MFFGGGCVRDLLLKRVPKDFDVITTANLKQIKNHFHRSHIVGRHFPVCVVHIRGHDIEVSSFDTVANTGFAERENSVPRLMPRSCHETDMLLWRNSMQRDFTVNSLFFDPYNSRIYDSSGGMTDL
uniref:Poly A polymerase head domain-containing protein n=1 Tax=Kalanchoe fedtschenkoi TaxID=63787 RepID=A0A7N0TD45_KALFE